MYFNDIHILGYLLIGLIGCVVGQILGLVNERLINHERIFCKGSLKKFKIEYEAHYGFMTLMFIFYAGIIALLLDAVTNPVTGMSFALNRLEGMIAGGGIFMLITVLGGLIMGKEAMGMGDVKLVGALGLFFGLKNILAIAVCSFLLGAIIGVFLMIIRKTKSKDYIPFGPFIVASTIILMLTPEGFLFTILWTIFSGEWLLKLFNR